MRHALVILFALILAFQSHGVTPGITVSKAWADARGIVPAAAYRTIVIFGDNQYESRDCRIGGEGFGRCADFVAELAWVEANKTAENIDFVGFVGDLIDSGTVMPPTVGGSNIAACDAEDFYTSGIWTVPMASEATCRAGDGVDIGACEAIGGANKGCFHFSGGPNHCLTCARHELILDEADAFETIVKRDITTPWGLVKGNHDNPGDQNATNIYREPSGVNQRFNSTYWDSIDNPGAGYEHVSSYTNALGDGHAWTFMLGSQQVIAVAMPLGDTGGVYSVAAATWASDTFAAHPTLPGILIAHWYGRGTWPATTPIDDIPNLFAIVSGHTGANEIDLVTDGATADSIVKVVNDFTTATAVDENAASQNDYITLIRWYPDTEEIEVKNWSVAGNAFMDAAAFTTATSRSGEVAKVAFDISSPTPFDLTPYSTEIAASLGTHTWAAPPTITSGPTVVTDCPGLLASAAVAGRHTRVETGVTIGSSGTPCGSMPIAANAWLELQGTAEIYASPSQNAANSKVTGGFIHAASTWSIGADDVHIENVNMDKPTGVFIESNPTTARTTIVNNTISAGSYCYLSGVGAPLPKHTDTSIINNACTCATSQDESCFRVQDGQRTLYARNWAYNTVGLKACYRMYDGSADGLVIDNYCDTTGLAAIEIRSTGDGPTDHRGIISNIHVIDNKQITDRTGTFNWMVYGGNAGDPGASLGSCDDFVTSGNERWTTTPTTYTEGVSDCTNVSLGGGVTGDLDLTPYFGVIPSAASLGIGADH